MIFKTKYVSIKRKRIFPFIFFFALLFINAQIKFGVKTGLNISSLYGDINSNNSKAGAYAGAYLRLPLTDKISIQPEVLFSMEGTEINDDDYYWGNHWNYRDYKEKYELNYIKIPVMIQYKIINGLRAEIGPQVSFIVSKKHTYSYRGYQNDYKPRVGKIRSLDIGLSAGANYELSSGLNFTARYSVGFINVNDNIASNYYYYNDQVRNQLISAGIGYSF